MLRNVSILAAPQPNNEGKRGTGLPLAPVGDGVPSAVVELSDGRGLKLKAFTWKRGAYGYAGMRADLQALTS